MVSIEIKPPHGPVTITLNTEGELSFSGRRLDVSYVKSMLTGTSDVAGHVTASTTLSPLQLSTKVFSAFGDAGEVVKGQAVIDKEAKRVSTLFERTGRFP